MEQELKWEIGKTYRMRRGAAIKKEFIEKSRAPERIQKQIFDFFGYKQFTVTEMDYTGSVVETSLGNCHGLDPFFADELKYFEEVPAKEPVDDLDSKQDAVSLTVEEINTGINAGIENLDKGAELRNLLYAAIYTMPFHLNLNYEKVEIKSLEQFEKFLKRKVKAKARNVEENIKFIQKRIDADEKTVIDAKNDHALLKSVL